MTVSNILQSDAIVVGSGPGGATVARELARLTGEICEHLGERRVFKPGDIPLLEETYAVPKYGVPSPTCQEAILRLARLEGILLDPIYTGKAFTGLLDLVGKGRLGSSEPIIFLHTGGLPAMFAFDEIK